MAWRQLLNFNWEYDDDPPNPNNAQTPLWAKQTNGIRVSTFDGTEIYTKCREVGDADVTRGELNKTYLDYAGHTVTGLAPSGDFWVTLTWDTLTWTG